MTRALRQLVAGWFLVVMTTVAFGQATLLPNAEQQFFDTSGNPLASGTVDFYIPNTNTRKNTWQNSTQTTLNVNPVELDAGGRAVIYGSGTYRQVVKDSSGNTIWDGLTASTGEGGGGTAGTGDGLAVGSILPFSGITAPTGYAFAYGQAVSRTTYADLLAAITISSATATCSSGVANIGGFASTEQVRVGAPIEASCLAPGTTVKSIVNATTVEASANAASSGTVTAVIFPFGAGDGSTTFNVPDLRARVPTGRDNMGGSARVGTTGASYLGGTLGLPPFSNTAPTYQYLTSGTTYNRPTGVTKILVQMAAGGGGGGGSGSGGGAGGAGGTGGTTSFNSITVIGGSGGGTETTRTGGAGGTGGAGSAQRWTGSDGSPGSAAGTTTTDLNFFGGGSGGAGFGGTGAGRGGAFNAAGSNGGTNTGAGGGGGGGDANNEQEGSAGGGGAGQQGEFTITTPAASYTYAIGAAGTAGTGDRAGGAGGTGVIVVTEYYTSDSNFTWALASGTGTGEPENLIANYIIKIATNGGSGVVNDIEGMTGSVLCNQGITCDNSSIYFQTVPDTFASTSTCNGGNEGKLATISDSNTAVWGATVAGGGSDRVLAYCNGTNWTVAAK